MHVAGRKTTKGEHTVTSSQEPAAQQRRTWLSVSAGDVAERIDVRVNKGSGDPFVIVNIGELGRIHVLAHDPAECYRIAAAFTEAGDKLAAVIATLAEGGEKP